jgi:hypothetical protein
MAFPRLIPDGKGDPTNNAILLDTGKSSTEAFANKLKHLLKFGEKIIVTSGFTNLLHILDLLTGHLIFYIEKEFWGKVVSS